MYSITKKSVQGYEVEERMARAQYRANYFVQCIRLNMPDSEAAREISGIDTRSISLQCMLNTTGLTNNTNVTIFCETTASLRVGAQRAVDFVS